jgi:hypothetical protein
LLQLSRVFQLGLEEDLRSPGEPALRLVSQIMVDKPMIFRRDEIRAPFGRIDDDDAAGGARPGRLDRHRLIRAERRQRSMRATGAAQRKSDGRRVRNKLRIRPCQPIAESTYRVVPILRCTAGLRGRAMSKHSLAQIGVAVEAKASDAGAEVEVQAGKPSAQEQRDFFIERNGLRYAAT